MHPVKRVLGHLYFLYALVLFAITLLIVLIPIWLCELIKEPLRSRIMQPIFRAWLHSYMYMVFCPVSCKGREHFDKKKAFVITSNHNSFVDVPVVSPWIPEPNKTLAKMEMAKIPIFGVIYRSGSILVDRKNPNSRKESFTAMTKAVDMGLHLCLYPEGTRNKTDQPLQPFHDGAFIVAIRTQKPILPTVLFNTKSILPGRPKFWAWPSRIHMHFLEPVPTAGMSLRQVEELKNKVHGIMESYFVNNRDRLA